jgi:hypothetical protein
LKYATTDEWQAKARAAATTRYSPDGFKKSVGRRSDSRASRCEERSRGAGCSEEAAGCSRPAAERSEPAVGCSEGAAAWSESAVRAYVSCHTEYCAYARSVTSLLRHTRNKSPVRGRPCQRGTNET